MEDFVKYNSRNTAITGMFAAISIIFAYIEVLIPFNIGIPGFKLGIANTGIILALHYLSWKEAIIVSFIRIIIIFLFFGNIFTLFLSFSGGIFSLAMMIILSKIKNINIITMSMAGGVMHNIGQLIAALFIIKRCSVLYYMPVMIFTGCATGFLIGIITLSIINTLKKWRKL